MSVWETGAVQQHIEPSYQASKNINSTGLGGSRGLWIPSSLNWPNMVTLKNLPESVGKSLNLLQVPPGPRSERFVYIWIFIVQYHGEIGPRP
jgi:hypothetical protein